MIRLCFVCLGNICRSPTAEGIFRGLVAARGLAGAFTIDSAGTGDWHVGEPPDPRTVETAKRHGLALDHRARQFRYPDYARFDYVLAMDRANLRALESMVRHPSEQQKLSLLRDHDPASAKGSDVPDPYYGGPDGFETPFAICRAACAALLDELVREHGLS